MRIAYLLDPSPLAEVDDVAGLHADALAGRGHVVRMIAIDKPSWLRGGKRAEWIEIDDWREAQLADDEVIVATSWPTARIASRVARRAFYLGSEPRPDDAPEIQAMPITPIVAEERYVVLSRKENDPLRVLLSGASQAEAKGIDDGYGAVAHARWFHQKLDLVRASPWAPSRDEPLDDVQEFHVGLNEEESTRLLQSCDAVLVPSHAEAGVSLIATDAMASGIPCVLTMTPAHLAIGEDRDYALFAPERNAVELGEQLIEMLSDVDARERLRARGREVAERWRASGVIAEVEKRLAPQAAGP